MLQSGGNLVQTLQRSDLNGFDFHKSAVVCTPVMDCNCETFGSNKVSEPAKLKCPFCEMEMYSLCQLNLARYRVSLIDIKRSSRGPLSNNFKSKEKPFPPANCRCHHPLLVKKFEWALDAHFDFYQDFFVTSCRTYDERQLIYVIY